MRTLTTAAAAALSGANLTLCNLIEMDFSPTVLRLSTWGSDLVFSGNTWIAVGPLGAVDSVKDTANASDSLQFSLSSVPSENVALALGSSVRNIACKNYLAILDPITHAVLDAPLIWAGVLDQVPITENGATSTIGVTARHIGSLFSRVKVIRYTDGYQQKVSPGDTSLRFIPSQSQHKDIWPSAAFFRQ